MEMGGFYPSEEVSLDNIVWLELVSHQSKVLLVAVSQAHKGNPLGQVNIYRLNNDYLVIKGRTRAASTGFAAITSTPSFNFLQRIFVEKPLEAHFSRLNSELYLFVINEDGYVTWFSQKGVQRFIKEGELHVPSKQHLEVWTSLVNGSQVPWISVTSQDCSFEDSAYNQETDQILHMNVRGNILRP
ncbi:hypothetical protein SK128_015534 [Halocaridina rubra]|uniref:Uncharacterized protein n=1 Tax=Halocaridina rubra TaxID=373956 RepID=A0AAN8ZVR7_HALRR